MYYLRKSIRVIGFPDEYSLCLSFVFEFLLEFELKVENVNSYSNSDSELDFPVFIPI